MHHSSNKRKFNIIVIIVAVVFLVAYLYAFFLPGVWHGNVFLYRQKDGTFHGHDVFADYNMQITKDNNATQIRFAINDTVNSYYILHAPLASGSNRAVEIIKNGTQVFKGQTIQTDPVMLMDENENLDIHISVSTTSDFFETPDINELFPTHAKLASWAINGTREIRGNTSVLILIFIFSAILVIDIAFPRFFFFLKHGLDVMGGEPSDFFLFGQKVGRILLALGIMICVVLSLTTH